MLSECGKDPAAWLALGAPACRLNPLHIDHRFGNAAFQQSWRSPLEREVLPRLAGIGMGCNRKQRVSVSCWVPTVCLGTARLGVELLSAAASLAVCSLNASSLPFYQPVPQKPISLLKVPDAPTAAPVDRAWCLRASAPSPHTVKCLIGSSDMTWHCLYTALQGHRGPDQRFLFPYPAPPAFRDCWCGAWTLSLEHDLRKPPFFHWLFFRLSTRSVNSQAKACSLQELQVGSCGVRLSQ